MQSNESRLVTLPEGVTTDDNEDYKIVLSNAQLKGAVKKAESFLANLDSNLVNGDHVRMAITLVYDSKAMQDGKLTYNGYNIRALRKFL